jgi:dUTP pyrophosphatase
MSLSEAPPITSAGITMASQPRRDPNNTYAEFILFQKLKTDAIIPSRATPGSVGYDLRSIANGCVPARGSVAVETGIAVHPPMGTFCKIESRSGLAMKNGIYAIAGIIDPDYNGEVKVVLVNHSDTPFSFVAGTKIAQIVVYVCETPDVKRVKKITDIYPSERGDKGFGSTGL